MELLVVLYLLIGYALYVIGETGCRNGSIRAAPSADLAEALLNAWVMAWFWGPLSLEIIVRKSFRRVRA